MIIWIMLVDPFCDTNTAYRLHNEGKNVTVLIASDVLSGFGPPKITKPLFWGFHWLFHLTFWTDVRLIEHKYNSPDLAKRDKWDDHQIVIIPNEYPYLFRLEFKNMPFLGKASPNKIEKTITLIEFRK